MSGAPTDDFGVVQRVVAGLRTSMASAWTGLTGVSSPRVPGAGFVPRPAVLDGPLCAAAGLPSGRTATTSPGFTSARVTGRPALASLVSRLTFTNVPSVSAISLEPWSTDFTVPTCTFGSYACAAGAAA